MALTMKTKLSLLFSCLLAQAVAAEGPWESLFNGKDLTGWLPVHDVTFVVTNGNLRLVSGMGWTRLPDVSKPLGPV